MPFTSTQGLAQDSIDDVLLDCGVQDLYAEPSIDEGENVFGEQGTGALNDLDPPEEVLMHWVIKKRTEDWTILRIKH